MANSINKHNSTTKYLHWKKKTIKTKNLDDKKTCWKEQKSSNNKYCTEINERDFEKG